MNIEQVLARNRADQQAVTAEIKEVSRVRYYLESEARALNEAAGYLAKRQLVSQVMDQRDREARKGQKMGLTPADVDLTGADTLSEMIRRVAQRAPHHEIRLVETTDLLVALGVTKWKRASLKAMIHRRCERMPDFCHVGRGWWRMGDEDATVAGHRAEAIRDAVGRDHMWPRLPGASERRTSMGLRPEDLHMTGAVTRWQQLLRIAQAAPTGEVCTIEATDLLISLGLVPRSSRESCRGALHQKMKHHPDFFRSRRGWFFYLRWVGPESVEVPDEFVAEGEEFPVSQLVRWLPGNLDYSITKNLMQRIVLLACHTEDGVVGAQPGGGPSGRG